MSLEERFKVGEQLREDQEQTSGIEKKAAEYIEEAPKHKAEKKSEPQAEAFTDKSVEEIKHKIEKEAKSSVSTSTKIEKSEEKQPVNQTLINKELKAAALNRTLARLHRQLPWFSKGFSKFTHQPVINNVSQIGEKTIARPYPILSGGIFALIGSSLVLYMAKHYGFRYNALLFVVLFVGGYLLGAILELVIRIFRHKNS